MALNDAATIVINAGNYFLAPVGTALPVNLLAPEVAWSNLGHTSLEDILAFSSEGGESTVLGTLQSKSLRTSTSPRTEAMAITARQFDADTLKLYYGDNMVDVNEDGTLWGVPDSPTPTVTAFLAVYRDAAKVMAYYAPKAEIARGDDLSFADTESLAGLPLTIRPLNHLTNTWPYAIVPPVPS